jgi:hypothetical protein
LHGLIILSERLVITNVILETTISLSSILTKTIFEITSVG